MQSIHQYLQKGIIIADQVCDYLPFYSHYNNGVCLIAKGILYGMKSYSPSSYAKIQNSHAVKHLEQKKVLHCVLLSIPFLNITISIVRDFTPFFLTIDLKEGFQQENQIKKGKMEYERIKKEKETEFGSQIKCLQELISNLPVAYEHVYAKIFQQEIEYLKTAHESYMELLSKVYSS